MGVLKLSVSCVLCVCVCICPCIDGVRGDNRDKSDSSMGTVAAYSVVLLCVGVLCVSFICCVESFKLSVSFKFGVSCNVCPCIIGVCIDNVGVCAVVGVCVTVLVIVVVGAIVVVMALVVVAVFVLVEARPRP